MRRRLSLILLGFAALIFLGGYFARESTAQKRTFSHNTKAHKEGKYKDCSSCHSLPTKNWTSPRRDKQPPFPDVATFPYHNSCFACHTKDIYSRGGAFCGTCHVVPTMRARAVSPFPTRSNPSQFTTLFPHNVHQDLIASNERKKDFVSVRFVNASFQAQDDKAKPTFYNCAICHSTATQTPKLEARKQASLKPFGDLIPDTFEAPVVAAFFKESPDSHASCFTCHYQFKNLPEDKRSCAGCHELSKPHLDKNVTQRYSIKFNHDRVGHVEKDCMSCHLRIAQSNDIRTMKDADVPIMACKDCHAKQEEQRFRRILILEVDQRDESLAKKEQPVFQCTYCHTSAVGRFETPASHRK